MSMERVSEIAGAVNGFVFAATVQTPITAENFVPRIVPVHTQAHVPLEENHILWQR